MEAEVAKGAPREKSIRAKATTYPALLMTQNKHRFYFTTIPVDDLFEHCFEASTIPF